MSSQLFNLYLQVSNKSLFQILPSLVGDCYVAAVGCPDPRNDHAVVAVRFARECIIQMQAVVSRLEVSLGPGTGDLNLRVGIHSGSGKNFVSVCESITLVRTESHHVLDEKSRLACSEVNEAAFSSLVIL